MALCVAWLRYGQSDEGQELVFATDSWLRMGEAGPPMCSCSTRVP